MPLRSMMLPLFVLLVARPVFAQGWVEYTTRTDRFEVPAPGQPKVETITWDCEYGGKFPGRIYRWEERRTRYSVTVVDYSESERIHSELNHIGARLERSQDDRLDRGTPLHSREWPRTAHH